MLKTMSVTIQSKHIYPSVNPSVHPPIKVYGFHAQKAYDLEIWNFTEMLPMAQRGVLFF